MSISAFEATVLPGINLVASLLKRWLAGTYTAASANDHLLHCYLDEFIVPFNRGTAGKRGLLFC